MIDEGSSRKENRTKSRDCLRHGSFAKLYRVIGLFGFGNVVQSGNLNVWT